jgi:hypothetical protein
MSDISAVSSLSDLSRDLYYQYLINHNSMSTMFDALSGNSDDSSDSSGLTSAIGSGLGYGLSSLNSIEGLDSLYGLSGVSRSDDSLLGLSQGISGFAGILQSYLSAQTTQASEMADSMAGGSTDGGYVQSDLPDGAGGLSVFSGAEQEAGFAALKLEYK